MSPPYSPPTQQHTSPPLPPPASAPIRSAVVCVVATSRVLWATQQLSLAYWWCWYPVGEKDEFYWVGAAKNRSVALSLSLSLSLSHALSLSLSPPSPTNRVTWRLEHLCCEVALTVFITTSCSFPFLYFPLSNSFTYSSSCSCCCFLLPSLLCHLYYSFHNLLLFPPAFLILFISRLSLIVFHFLDIISIFPLFSFYP